jgi:alpha-1,2-mannosyltransferase
LSGPQADPAPAWSRWAVGLALSASGLRFGAELYRVSATCCDDFPIFWDAIHVYLDGGRLYPPERLADYGPGTPVYKFPPFYAVFLWLGAKLRPGAWVLPVHLWLQVFVYLAAVHLLTRCCGARRARSGAPLVWILALNHGPFFETLSALQVETPILFCLVLALWLLRLGRERAAGITLAVAAGLKVYPALMAFLLLSTRRWTSLVWFAAASAGSIAAGLVMFGPVENHVYFLRLLPQMLREAPAEHYGTENLGIASYLTELRGGHAVLLDLPAETALLVARALAGVLLTLTRALVASSRHRARETDALAAQFALFVPVTLLLLPNSWSNYQLLLLLPMGVVAGAMAAGMRRPLLGALLAASFLLTTYHQNAHAYYPFLEASKGPLFDAWQACRVVATLLLWLAVAIVLREPPQTIARARPSA